MIRLLRSDDRGISVPELMVAMILASIASLLLFSLLDVANRVDLFSRDDSQVLDELRFASQMIKGDVREGRLVYDDSTDRILHIWIDSDIDNQQDANERVYWEIRTTGGDTDLVRYTEANTNPVIIAETIVDGPAFAYNPGIGSDPRTVTITLTADEDPAEPPAARVIESEIRLRNVETP